MRKLLIVGTVLAVALVVVGAALALRLSSYLSTHRDVLAAEVSRALGRPVELADIGLSWRGGLSASVHDLRIAEDPRFGSGDFLQVAQAYVVVRLLPALRGNYEIHRVQLDAPRIRILRDHNGFNFDSLGQQRPRESAELERPAAEESSSAVPEDALALLVAAVRIDQGSVVYIDRRTDPPSQVAVEGLDFSATDAALGSTIAIDVEGRVVDFGDARVKITGEIGPLTNPPALNDLPLSLRGTFGPFLIDRLKQHTAAASVIPSKLSCDEPLALSGEISGTLGNLSGSLSLDSTDAHLMYGDTISKPAGTPLAMTAVFAIDGETVRIDPMTIELAESQMHGNATITGGKSRRIELTLGGEGLPAATSAEVLTSLKGYDLSGAIDIDLRIAGEIADSQPPPPAGHVVLHDVGARQAGITINGLTTKVAVQGDRIEMPLTGFALNGAPVELAFTFDNSTTTFSSELKVRTLDAQPILVAHAPELAEQVAGKVDTDLHLTGTGLEWPRLRDSLQGRGRIDVKEGVLRNVNVAEAVLSSATGIQGLTQLVSASTRREYPGLLTSADTNFETLQATLQIADGVVSTNDLRLRAPHYSIDGRGEVRLDNRVSFHAVLRVSEQLTDDICDEVKAAKLLRNPERQLEVPFRLKGAWPHVRPKADEEAMLEALGRGSLGKGLADLLGERKPEGEKTGKKRKPGPEDLLRQGLDKLFGR
jgi:uncharacterized protein involved in outer membrane biogenesis